MCHNRGILLTSAIECHCRWKVWTGSTLGTTTCLILGCFFLFCIGSNVDYTYVVTCTASGFTVTITVCLLQVLRLT